MTAQKPAKFTNGKLRKQLFDTQRLLEELHHPHPARRAAAVDVARWLLALENDRFTFFEGTRAEVWSNIFDSDRLQADIDRGDPRRCARDPMRATGARLVVEALMFVLALRTSSAAVELDVEPVCDAEHADIVERLHSWIGEGATGQRRAA